MKLFQKKNIFYQKVNLNQFIHVIKKYNPIYCLKQICFLVSLFFVHFTNKDKKNLSTMYDDKKRHTEARTLCKPRYRTPSNAQLLSNFENAVSDGSSSLLPECSTPRQLTAHGAKCGYAFRTFRKLLLARCEFDLKRSGKTSGAQLA